MGHGNRKQHSNINFKWAKSQVNSTTDCWFIQHNAEGHARLKHGFTQNIISYFPGVCMPGFFSVLYGKCPMVIMAVFASSDFGSQLQVTVNEQ